MTERADRVRETVWALLTTFVLVVRLLATIAMVLFVVGWAVVSVRQSVLNGWLWPSIGSCVALLISTWLYSYLRARHPRRNGWEP
ncbi:hypothetical protein [Gordonia soli]|nr:hypothetical protein [Gordonia soli]